MELRLTEGHEEGVIGISVWTERIITAWIADKGVLCDIIWNTIYKLLRQILCSKVLFRG